MLPDFDNDGFLPEGVHEVTWEEFEERFAINYKRRKLLVGLKRLVADLKIIGCSMIYVDGSYVTNKALPGDIDVLWCNIGMDFNSAILGLPVLGMMDFPRSEQQDVYNCDIFPSHFVETQSGQMFISFFQNKKNEPGRKGIVKLALT